MPMIACASGTGSPSQAATPRDRAQLLPAGTHPMDGPVQDLAGKKMNLADLRGHPALLDFFATWCEPCRLGLPRTDALLQKNSTRGLQGWAISIDDKIDPVAPFAKKLGLQIPVRWDEGAKCADDLRVEVLPAVILLDAKGAVRYRAAPDDRDFDRHLEEAVDALLAEEKR